MYALSIYAPSGWIKQFTAYVQNIKKKSHALYNRDINVDFFCVFTGKNHVHEHKSKK